MRTFTKNMDTARTSKKNVSFLAILSFVFVSSFAHAQAVPAPYKMSGVLGDVLDPNTSDNTKLLETFVAAIEREGWQVNLKQSTAIVHHAYQKAKGESISDIVVNKTKGCDAFDKGCLRLIKNLNRGSEFLSNNYQGEVLLPTQEIQFEVSIDAGSNYREETIGQLTKAFMSRRLHDLSLTIVSISVPRISQICFGECTDLYQLTIE
jgi:hypothetical protein